MDSVTTPTPARPDRRGAFLLLFFALVVVGAGNTMLITAVLPLLVRALEFPAWTAGAIFSLSAFMWVVFSPFWGKLSNDWGRRRVAAIGMFGFSVSMLLFGLSGAAGLLGLLGMWQLVFVCLIASRSLFGIFGSGTNPAAQAYVADRTGKDERTEEIATLTSGFTFGTVFGPALAGTLITVMGLLSPVFVISAVAAVIGALILFTLPETRPPKAKRVSVRAAKGLWRDAGLAPYLIYGVGLSLISGVLVQTFPFAMLDGLGLEGKEGAQELSIVMTLGALATLVTQLVLIPRLKLPVRDLMVWGALCLAAGCAVSISMPELSIFAFAQILFGLGQGLSRPGFTSGASLAVGADLQGNVAGLVTAANGMGFIVSPFFGLWAYENIHPYAPFIFCGVVLILMGIFAYFRASGTPPSPRGEAEVEE